MRWWWKWSFLSLLDKNIVKSNQNQLHFYMKLTIWWFCLTVNLHGGEVPLPVEHKLHLHVSLSPQRVVPPAQVVVARPHVVLTGLEEVVQADHAVRQLTQPARQPPIGGEGRQSQRENRTTGNGTWHERVWLASSRSLRHTWSRWSWRW